MATTSTTTSSAPSTTREATERALPTLIPAVDIYETDSHFVLLADMPGVAADAVEVKSASPAVLAVPSRTSAALDTLDEASQMAVDRYRLDLKKGDALRPIIDEMRRFGHEWLGCPVHPH